jgi:acetyltransferase-like isoleucine patch superfamily enzyme
VATFVAMLTLVVALTSLAVSLAARVVPPGDFRGVALVGLFVVLFYLASFGVYRVFLKLMPLTVGPLAPGSKGEFAAQVNILFYLLIFNTLVRSHLLPVPLMRLVYLALGARLGDNTYSAGALLDPPLFSAGANCIIGHDAVLFCHAIEGEQFSLAPVRLGDSVTIGACAIVMSDVEVGSGAIVSAGSVVRKGARIGAGEIWGGVPARRLRAAASQGVSEEFTAASQGLASAARERP